jgi:CDGSH-type Zn-finger protein/uncharacterized Fe-S cluster protein YjdI
MWLIEVESRLDGCMCALCPTTNEESPVSDDKITTYPGQAIDVHWDERLCIHIGECGNAKGDLFVGSREPWCLPDLTAKAEVREICERCPSGALTYADKEGNTELPAAENTIQVTYRGPLYATGDLAIEGVAGDMPGVRFRAALCRCGASKNKPFCDNSHLKSGFDDTGSVGETGLGSDSTGGTLSIKPLPDGPLLLNGNLTIRAGSGRLAWQGAQTALCRCGASRNKPFCDGSHKKVGFKSE